MTLAFWNNGTPRVVRTNKRVILPGGDIVFNAKPNPEIDLYTYLEVGAAADRFHVMSGTAFANDGWSITATYTQTLKPLAELKALRLADLSAYKKASELGGMTWVDGADTYIVDTGESSQFKATGAMVHMNEAGKPDRKWTMLDTNGDKVRPTLTKARFRALAIAIADHVDAAYATQETHEAAIGVLTDQQAVVDYDITTGWPANPEPGQ
jgi:hypothetical protein